jgi:hypothetical protein
MFIFGFIVHMIAISAMFVGAGLIACFGIILGCIV